MFIGIEQTSEWALIANFARKESCGGVYWLIALIWCGRLWHHCPVSHHNLGQVLAHWMLHIVAFRRMFYFSK